MIESGNMNNETDYYKEGFWDCRNGYQSLASTLAAAGETAALDAYVKGWYKANESAEARGVKRRAIQLYWEFNK